VPSARRASLRSARTLWRCRDRSPEDARSLLICAKCCFPPARRKASQRAVLRAEAHCEPGL
jgi:hypothetical protein